MQNQEKPIKIFAMESDEFFRIFLQDTFIMYSPCKVSLDFSSNIEDSLQFLNKNLPDKPDIIFLCLSIMDKRDGKMELLGGFKVLQALRGNTEFKEIPIIIFSKYSDKKIQSKAKKLGATKYIVKGEFMPKDIAEITFSHNVPGR